jgi:hypothetical protein
MVSADMLDAYLQGKLPPEQQAAFESFIIDKPELLEQAELGLLMHEGFRANETGSQVPKASQPPKSRAVPQWRLAAAAAILSIGLGSLIGYSVGGFGQGDSIDGLLASQIVNLPITRSESAPIIEVTVADDTELVILRVSLPDPELRAYAVSISGEAGPVGAPAKVEPDGGGMLSIAVNAADLPAGDYSISVDEARQMEPLVLRVSRAP